MQNMLRKFNFLEATTLLIITIVACLFVSNQAQANDRLYVPEYKVFGNPASKADADAVNTLLTKFQTAWSQQDTPAVMKLYAKDIEWINAYARMFRGHKELSQFLDNVLFVHFAASVSQGEVNNMQPISLRYLGDDVAIFHGFTDGLRGKSVLKGKKFRRTHFHFVMHKQEGKWLFVHKTISDARDSK